MSWQDVMAKKDDYPHGGPSDVQINIELLLGKGGPPPCPDAPPIDPEDTPDKADDLLDTKALGEMLPTGIGNDAYDLIVEVDDITDAVMKQMQDPEDAIKAIKSIVDGYKKSDKPDKPDNSDNPDNPFGQKEERDDS
jgi:hypothetical protein